MMGSTMRHALPSALALLIAGCSVDGDEILHAYTGQTVKGQSDPGQSDTGQPDTGQPVTWTDPSTGLVWQNPSFDGTKTWEEAKTFCTNNEAGLPGTGWRLPNISELRSLIRGCPNTVTGGACGVTDVCPKCGVGQSCLSWSPCHDYCGYCFNGSGPADGCYWPNEMEGPCSWYWSSSPVEDNVYHAWLVYFSTGYVGNDVVNYARYVRCVR